MITDLDLEKLAEDIQSCASKVAQEVFLERRKVILKEIYELTGKDFTEIIPTIKKGRPKKKN